MRSEAPIRPDEVSRASAEAEAHARAAALSAFADDVLFRQAEGRQLYAGEEFVRLRADAHGVLAEDAETPLGNLVEILERGPERGAEHALVAAFAVRGLAARVRRAPPEERLGLLDRFVSHADWLETATPYRVHVFARTRLYEGGREQLRDALVDRVLAEATGPLAGDPGARSRHAVRLTALAELPGGDAALERVSREAGDAAVRVLAASLRADGPFMPRGDDALVVEGRVGRVPSTPGREALRLVTGWALLRWVARGLGALLGLDRRGEATLLPTGVRIRRTTTVFGRRVRDDEVAIPLVGVLGVVRYARWPSVHLLVGALALGAGVLVGGVSAADAVRTGETWLLLVAAGALLLGAGLDLGLEVLVPARAARVALEIRVRSGAGLRLTGVDLRAADRFLAAIERELRPGRA